MSAFPVSVKGTLNFAADRSDGGSFSNFTGQADQKLLPVEVDIINARSLAHKPTLDEEGFALVAHPAGEAAWSDKTWLNSVYVPSCLELVKRLTGATATLQMYYPIVRRRVASDDNAATAGFIHIDQPRDVYRPQAEEAAAALGIKLQRGAIYNVWKAITPPPQDLPLAVADRRTIDANDHVLGMSVEAGNTTAYFALAHSPKAPTWYYFPDMTPEESLVFLAADFDPGRPLGCAHTAFSPPPIEGGCVPRASVEVRVIASFD